MAAPLIAVVDDEAVFRALLDEFLTDAGYAVCTWPATMDLYGAVRSALPAVLVIDLPITRPAPFWTLLRRLRRDPTTARLPIIVCSAAPDLLHHNTTRLHDLGCGVLEKPFDLDNLLERLAELVVVAVGAA